MIYMYSTKTKNRVFKKNRSSFSLFSFFYLFSILFQFQNTGNFSREIDPLNI